MDSKKDLKKSTETQSQPEKNDQPKVPKGASQGTYFFGGIKEFDLEQIESEVLNDNIYLDVFAGSDLSLKKDVQPTSPALASICRLDTIKYKWNENAPVGLQADSTVQLGFIAQQVAQEFPELVRRDTESGFLAVNYQKLNVHLVSAIKELTERLELQNQRIQILENKLTKN